MNRRRTPWSISRRELLGYGALTSAAAGLGSLPFAQPVFAQAVVEGSTLRARIFADISNLDPAFWTSAGDALVMEAIYAFPMQFETNIPEFRAGPLAFKSVEQTDETHVAFELHPGIRYSGDYGEMTAEDAKFSWERIADPALNSPYQGDWSALDHVEVTGTHSGVIVLKAPFAPLFSTTLPTPSSAILPRAALEAAGGQFSTRPPVFSGPYRIADWQPRTRLLLERNPDFTLYDVAFDRLELIPIEDPKTAERGFEAGDLDFTDTSVSSIPRLDQKAPAGAGFEQATGLRYYWLGINQDNTTLQDHRVRRALQLGIDRQAVVDATFLGAAQPSAGIIAPALVGHRTENIYSYDAAQARALLDEAGQVGLGLTLSIQQTTEDLAAAQVIQALLADIGITVTVNQYETGTFWSLGHESDGDAWKDLQLFLFSNSMQPDPFWATTWFTTDQVGVWNWQRFTNEEFDRLHEAAARETDPTKRQDMYVRMQDLMEESGDFVFLTFEPTGNLWAERVAPALRPDGVPIFARFGKA